MAENHEIEAELHYVDLEGNLTNTSNTESEENPTIAKDTIFTLPLGYGKVGLRVGTVTEVDPEEKLIKNGDLVLIYGLLKDPVESGALLTEEQKEYGKNHTVAQIVITKDYAKSLAKVLLAYATSSSEDDFMKRL